MNRDDARAHLWYAGIVLAPTGRIREADFHQQRAAELDPISPVVMSGFATDGLLQRQYDLAISACQRALELDPLYPWALRWLGEAYLPKGMYKEAADTLQRIGTPVFGCGLLGWSYVYAGRLQEARQMLRGLEQQADPALSCQTATLHLAFGDERAALQYLERARVSRNVGVYWLKVDPIWNRLRPNVEFRKILGRMRLEPSPMPPAIHAIAPQRRSPGRSRGSASH